MSVLALGEVGPQVNKFEQVSSDDHQMSVDNYVPFICMGKWERGGEWKGVGARSDVRRGVGPMANV